MLRTDTLAEATQRPPALAGLAAAPALDAVFLVLSSCCSSAAQPRGAKAEPEARPSAPPRMAGGHLADNARPPPTKLMPRTQERLRAQWEANDLVASAVGGRQPKHFSQADALQAGQHGDEATWTVPLWMNGGTAASVLKPLPEPETPTPKAVLSELP